jgi:hypothetical protein
MAAFVSSSRRSLLFKESIDESLLQMGFQSPLQLDDTHNPGIGADLLLFLTIFSLIVTR